MEFDLYRNYSSTLANVLETCDFEPIHEMALQLQNAWRSGHRIYICGNGGSAANAIHLANDFLYGVASSDGKGLRVSALSANSSILTCLANDIDYDSIFSKQILTQADEGDVLIALSGSGNSPNIIKALKTAVELKMITIAILGYSGGKCLELADILIHFPIDDMQIAEDLQIMVGHMVTRWLSKNPVRN